MADLQQVVNCAALYAARLVQAGVPVEHRRSAGQPHAFVGLLSAPGSEEGFDFVAAAVERRIEQAVRT